VLSKLTAKVLGFISLRNLSEIEFGDPGDAIAKIPLLGLEVSLAELRRYEIRLEYRRE
jgi:hypothetical protein